MQHFKIHFELKEPDMIEPWGQTPNRSLSWFGLTDGLLWIDVGPHTIYEYSKAAQNYWNISTRYNDYQISRFLEDFSETFPYVAEPIPKWLYHSIEAFEERANQWKNLHIDEPDEIFDQFYFDEFLELTHWKSERSFDSGHLIGGPYIGCFRYGDKLKLLWESNALLENRCNIWTAPCGCYEVSYEKFTYEVKRFFGDFFAVMDRQVEQVIKMDWKDVLLDKERLVKEHTKRKEGFSHQIGYLSETSRRTDWKKIEMLYKKMENDTKQVTKNRQG